MTTPYAENGVFVVTPAPPRAEVAKYELRWTEKPSVSPPPHQAALRATGRVIAVAAAGAAQATGSLMLVPHPHARFRKWFVKLRSLIRLKEGWDSYAAPAPNEEAIAAAESYLSILELLGWEPTRVEASVMGGVGVTHRQGPRKVYVEFYNNGKVHALFSDRTPRMETFPVGSDVPSYYRFIRKAKEYLNG